MKPRPDLAVEDADGELIVLDKASGKVHQLNATASLVWSCLSDGLSIDETALALSEAFQVEAETARTDVQALIAQFEELKLFIE